MDWWLIGLITLCVVGIAVIGLGAFWDRHKHRRATTEMLSAPTRDIPQLPADAGTPAYLSRAQALRPADRSPGSPRATNGPASTDLNGDERAELTRHLEQSSTRCLPVGYASSDFVTDTPSKRAILDHPRVLVSAEPVMAIRELIGPLEHMISQGSAIVIVVPSMRGDVLETLRVNKIQRYLQALVVVTKDPQVSDAICSATGARLIDRVDLQSGYVTDSDLGYCRRWVCDRNNSYLVKDPDHAGSETDQP